MLAPPQQPPINRPTYSRTLSTLHKTELIQLSVDFKLPTDGNVVTLRNRLRVYMNYHQDALINNPRYRALFPKAQDPNIPIRHSDLSSQTVRTPSSTALSYDCTPSPIPLVPPHQPIPQHPLPHYQEPNIY